MHHHARRLVPLAAAIAVAVALPSTASAAKRTVKVDDFAFKPASLSIAKGTKVKWKFLDSEAHNVAVISGPVKFKSKTMKRGTYKHKFKQAGTYKLHCTIHPDMRQTIAVG